VNPLTSDPPTFVGGMNKVECVLCGWEKWTGNDSQWDVLSAHEDTCRGFRIVMVQA